MNILVIDFYATWCSPCKMQDSILEELKKKYGDKVEFKKVNVDGKKDETKLAEKHHVAAVPTIIIEKDRESVKRHVGVTSLKVLEKDIETLLKEK